MKGATVEGGLARLPTWTWCFLRRPSWWRHRLSPDDQGVRWREDKINSSYLRGIRASPWHG